MANSELPYLETAVFNSPQPSRCRDSHETHKSPRLRIRSTMVRNDHGTHHPFPHRRLHRPRRSEPQNSLRHAGRRAGRRGRRHRHSVGIRRAGRGTEAPSRHHAHLSIRSGGGRGGRGRRLALQPLAGASTTPAAPEARQQNGETPPTRQLQPVSLGWVYLAQRSSPRSATSCSTGPTTTASGPFSLSTRAGMRAALSSSPSRCCGRCSLSALIIPWLLGLADREIGAPAHGFSRPRLGHLRSVRMVVLWLLALGGARAGPRPCSKTPASHPAPIRRMAVEPYPLNPFRWHAIVETDDFYQTAEINTRTGYHRQRPRARRALQTHRHRRRRSCQAHSARPGLSRLGYVGRGARHGPGAVTGMDPPQLPPGRTWTTVEFTRLAICILISRYRARGGATAAQRLGLHRRRPRGRRRIHGRAGPEVEAHCASRLSAGVKARV